MNKFMIKEQKQNTALALLRDSNLWVPQKQPRCPSAAGRHLRADCTGAMGGASRW